jgi:MerR family redox-sensitive transcriptional activator SoxR
MTQVPSAVREITVGHRLTGCIACGCLSLSECQLANPDDLLGAGGSGPRRLSGQPGHGQGGGEQDDGP